jgi:dTDP-4-dehydrorhamnose reductase
MNILLLGNTGQLGWELQRTLAPLGQVAAFDYPEVNLADASGLRQMVRHLRPQVIVNATAFTAVDRAESETELAIAVNSRGPGILAEEAAALGAALLHFSTDYVFDGAKGSAYIETDIPNPLNVYGRSKWVGEQAIQQVGGAYLILRTSWVYSLRRDSFVNKVLKWARQQRTLRLVTDQVSNPTWARMLAEVTAQMLAMGRKDIGPWLTEHRGLYHLAGDGYVSRMEWAQAILRCDPRRGEQVIEDILPGRTDDFPSPACRPLFSALNCDHFFEVFGLRLPPWEEALKWAMSMQE